MDIGCGITIDAALFEPILAVSHPDHGMLSLPGDAAEAFNQRADAMRERIHQGLPSSAGPEAARITRLIQICQEAIDLDPDMRDGAGTPIRPLIEQHLPTLAQRHQSALALSSPQERLAIDADLEDTLEIVARAVGEGMSNVARSRRDALRNELHFLRLRHA